MGVTGTETAKPTELGTLQLDPRPTRCRELPTSDINASIQRTDVESERGPNDNAHSLPRADSGRDAWTVLAGAFILEAIVWGFPFAFGVFQRYYSTHEPFRSGKTGIAAISTTASGIMYLSSPVIAILLQRYPWWRRPMGFIGLVIMLAALVGASFSNNTSTLLATQGVLYAIGGMMLYFPALHVIDEWFIARKGLAYGMVWTGTAVSGATVPFICQWLLDRYGFRTTLRVWAIISLIAGLPATVAMKNRLPVSSVTTLRPQDFSFLKRPPFWIITFGNFMQAIAYFIPALWLPSFASSLGFPKFSGALALCLLNIGAGGGYIVQGALHDHFEVTLVVLMSTLLSIVSIFVFWGLTVSQPMLYVFSIVWGLSGGGYASLWSGFGPTIAGNNNGRRIDTGLVIGLLAASKGIGTLISGPLSEQLLLAKPWRGVHFAYGTEYALMIICCGVTATLGGTAWVGRVLKLL